MAGKPETHARLKLLDDDEDAVFDLIEGGEPLERVAMRLSDKYKEHISRTLLSRWCSQPAERAARFARARAVAADAIADDIHVRSHELVRDVKLGLADKTDVQAVKVANDADQWIAGIWNREKYAQQTQAAVTVNIGSLHLDSLRQASLMPPSPFVDMGEAVEVRPALSLDDLL